MQNKLYTDYLELADTYYRSICNAGKNSFGCLVQEKHPWQRYI